jgi:DNA-binding IclR family transcriptional regulator
MSLKRALEKIPDDRTSEAAAKDILRLFRHHPDESLSVNDVARRAGLNESTVGMILCVLADSYVLSSDADRYLYHRDTIVDMEIERFLRRAETHNEFVQSNVAKFRERYGVH